MFACLPRLLAIWAASSVLLPGWGMDRSLTVGEMMAQVLSIQKDIGEQVSHVVLMGIGEPFDNYENVIRLSEA